MFPASRVCGVLIDMDGVIYHGRRLLPGVPEFLALLARQDLASAFVTNNSTRTPEQVAVQLADLGIQVSDDRIITSALATAQYLHGHAKPKARIYIIGEEGLYKALVAYGFDLTEENPEYVIVGLDRNFHFTKLEIAVKAIRNGAFFIATNSDPLLLTTEGTLEPGAGTLVAMIKSETDCKPLVIGKPAHWLFEMATRKLQCSPSEVVMIGDNIETDIRGAQLFGLTTVLVMTGMTTGADLMASDIKPDYVVDDLTQLARAWSL